MTRHTPPKTNRPTVANEATSGTARVTRRQALQTAAAAGVASAAAPGIIRAQGQPDGFNILFMFSDQERYMRALPPGLSLPGHERLRKMGVTFHNHYCPAVMCTSSRRESN